jgi:threonine efflux protein
MEFWHGFLLITVVHLLAAASPGPDFVMVTQQTLLHGKKTGMLCSLGIALGLAVHIAYSSFGLAALIASSLTALWVIKICGGCYLIYLGWKGLRAKPRNFELTVKNSAELSDTLKIIGKGFLCNVLNPKAPIYFVALFTIVLSPNMPPFLIVIYGLWIMVLQFLWFAFVTILLASPPVSRRFKKVGHIIDRVLGGAMILLGVKVLASRAT